MMTPRIYLHIGMNKTGTSAIQYFLEQHHIKLKDFGLLYPRTGLQRNAHYQLSKTLGFFHGSKTSLAKLSDDTLSLQKDLQKEISTCGAKDIVLSSEFFVLPKAIGPVKEIFSPFDVRIVVYLRRHDEWWQSAYAQAVKTVTNPPWGRGAESFILHHKRKNKGDYRALVDRWAHIFGKENVIVRPYEKAQNQPDLITDFFQAISRDDVLPRLDVHPVRVNESISIRALSMMEYYQRLNIDEKIRTRLLKHARTLQDGHDRQALISPTLQRQLVDENALDYEYIAKEYLGRKDGQLFYAPLPDPSQTWSAPKPLSRMLILENTLAALGHEKPVPLEIFNE